MVFLPAPLRPFYVVGLSPLRASTQQNDKVGILPEINPISWTEIDSKLRDSFSHRVAIPKVSILNAVESIQDDGIYL
jgi:hypothetical protein